MKRGVNTVDALIAIISIFFLFVWLQNSIFFNLSNANEFGIQAEVKSEAISVGSQMNSFYASRPNSSDYVIINDSIKIFSAVVDPIIYKDLTATNVTVLAVYNLTAFNSTYPVNNFKIGRAHV